MIHRFETLVSTQVEAHRLATGGAAAGTVVVAVDQTAGRGTRGRPWVSGSGGLWLTVLLRPASPRELEGLSVRIGLALAVALDVPDHEIRLKWPNDLMVADRKLGGILCEVRWNGDRLGWVAVGVGINVSNELPVTLRGSAVSLALLGVKVEGSALEARVIAAVVMASQGGGPLSTAELAAYARRDWLAGRAITSPVAGTAAGLGPDGSLLVRRADGTVARVTVSVAAAGLASPPGPR